MNEVDWPPYFGYTIFCDDIRREEGGKWSYMGAYKGVLFSNSGFPIRLPKFGFGINYFESEDEPAQPLTLMIYLPGDPEDRPSIVSDLPDIKSIGKDRPRPEWAKDGGSNRQSLYLPMVIAPLDLNEPGRIKVRIKRGDELIRLGSLYVQPNPTTKTQSDDGQPNQDTPDSA